MACAAGPQQRRSPKDCGSQLRHRGWLEKRGPIASFGWRRVWTVLHGHTLVFYEDDSARIKKGDLVLGPYMSPLPFSSPAVRHLGGASPARPPPDQQELAARPFGFAVQPASHRPPTHSAGAAGLLLRPPALYFDALGPEEFRLWMQAIAENACDHLPGPQVDLGQTGEDSEGVRRSDVSDDEPESCMSAGEVFECTAGEDVDRIGVAVLTLPPAEVEVKRVEPGLWADQVGILPGDIIVAVNGIPVQEMDEDDFKEALQYRPVTFSVSGFEEREARASSACSSPSRAAVTRQKTIMHA